MRDEYHEYSSSNSSSEEERMLEQQLTALKSELLFFHHTVDAKSLNPFQQEIFAGYVQRTLNQIPLAAKFDIHEELYEGRYEFLHFNKILNLQ